MSIWLQVLIVGHLSLGLSLTSVAQDQEFAGEKVVHLLQEPRHRTVHKQNGLFLLDVQINPGDTSFPHTHNQAILLTYINDENGPRFGELRSVPEYASKPLTHKVDNPGPGLLHIMALVNAGTGVPADTRDEPTGLEHLPTLENPWFRAYRLRLAPGETLPRQTHSNPTVIVQGSAGLLQVTRADGITHELSQAGDWAWRDAGAPFVIRNMSSNEVIVTINEGRRASR